MAVSKDKTGVLVNMDKTLKEKLSELAKKQNRSLSNLIVTILKDYVDSADKQSALFYFFKFFKYTIFATIAQTRIHKNGTIATSVLIPNCHFEHHPA